MAEINFGLSDPNAFFQGAANMSSMMDRVVRRKAGKALAGGDTEGAKAELNAGGLLGDAANISEEQRAMAAEGRTQDLHQSLMTQHLDAHNAAISKLSDTEKAESAQMLYDVSEALSNIRKSKGDVMAAFDQLVPLFKQRGATDEQLGQYREALQKNPDAVIDGMLTNSKIALQRFKFLDTSQGVAVGDTLHGTVAPGLGTPKIVNTAPGGITSEIPSSFGDAGAVPPAAAPPGAGAPAAPSVSEGPAATSQAPPPGTSAGGARVLIAGKPQLPPASPLGATDNYEDLSPDQMQALGYTPGTVGKRNTRTKEIEVTQAPIRTGTGGPTRLAPQDAIFLSKLRTEAQQSTKVSQLMGNFVALNRKVNTGGVKALPGTALFAKVFQQKEMVDMQSIADQLTPGMRNGLPGAASDRDVSMFQSAAPGVDKPRDVNTSIYNAAKAFAARQNDYIAFMEAWGAKKGNLLGAQEEWSAYAEANPLFKDVTKDGMVVPNKIIHWKLSFPDLKPDAPAAKGPRRYNPATGKIE